MKVSKESFSLFESTRILLSRNIKVGVLIVDEWQYYGEVSQDYISVDKKQEKVVDFAVRNKLPIWFIEMGSPTRKSLLDKVRNYDSIHFIEKINDSGFGTSDQETDLHSQLQQKGITYLIIMGFHVNCCVSATAGVEYDTGAISYGYRVLTSGDILRSSVDFPEKCLWKNYPGVIYHSFIGKNEKKSSDTFFREPMENGIHPDLFEYDPGPVEKTYLKNNF